MSRPLNASARITFWKLQVKADFLSRQIKVFLCFRTQSAEKIYQGFVSLNCSKKLQLFFEIELNKCGVIAQKSLSEKTKYFEIYNSRACFCSLYVKPRAIIEDGDRKFWDPAHLGNGKNFPIVRTNCTILIDVIYPRWSTHVSWVLVWMLLHFVIKWWAGCKTLLPVLQSDGKE